jgi:hypothetical protein
MADGIIGIEFYAPLVRRHVYIEQDLPSEDPRGLVRPPGQFADLIFHPQIYRKVGKWLRHYSIS